MKAFVNLTIALFAVFASVDAAPQRGNGGGRGGRGRNRGGATAVATSAAAIATAAPVADTTTPVADTNTGGAGGAVTRGATTLVLKEIGGVPGNECLTFRNNGEIVDAACVNEAADRQLTPSTNAAGQDVLLVQRSFSAGFRPDLVGVQACVGFNGTTFKAEDCQATDIQLVSLVGGQLQAGAACQSGHDDLAQLTVDPTGANCVGVTTTAVTPTAP
ncbi:hypothetical protein B0O99DRAFT_145361 [Bisporella sp. PMI_857]|nr:hypothetical protein B0O99DRAFT_145361 [Bisporella sp. PMI_857]